MKICLLHLLSVDVPLFPRAIVEVDPEEALNVELDEIQVKAFFKTLFHMQ